MATQESNRGGSKGSSSARKVAAAALNPDTIFEFVQRLGVMEIAVERVKARMEDFDYDDILDDAGRYIRRNPEVVVIGLGVLTLAAAAVVFLDSRLDEDRRWGKAFASDDDDYEDDEKPVRLASSAGKARPTATPAATRRRANS